MPTQTLFAEDRQSLFAQAARIFIDAVTNDFRSKNHVIVGLPGGRNIAGLLTAIKDAHQDLSADDWKRLHFFVVDERLVDLQHQDSNFRLLNEVFFQPMTARGVIEQHQIHPFHYAPELPDFGIRKYTQKLQQYCPAFDIACLSVGEDGHVAGLFPGHHSIESRDEGFIAMDDSPKPPSARMSSSAQLLAKTQFLFALFVGSAKVEAYRRYLDAKVSLIACPAKIVDLAAKGYVITDISKER